MIIINLKGGLGNQMFQYAFGRQLSITKKIELKLDKTGYDKNKYRSYSLDVFNTQADFATDEEIAKLKYPWGLVSKGWRWFKFKILRLQYIGWFPDMLKVKDNSYIDGFWQSYKYFDDIIDVLAKEFSLKIPLEETHSELIKQMTSTNSVALSVRRTDYLWPQNLRTIGICSANYYNKAIDLIASKIKNPYFFIVTDDLDWVKENIDFKGYPVFYVSELRKDNSINYYQEMMIMSKCKHGIIANSSFSWWPALLSINPDKIIIAPNPWFTISTVKTEDIIPPTWIKLPRD